MNRKIFVLIAVVFFIQGCSATYELKRARRWNEHRVVSYSPQSGKVYRLPPFEEPFEEAPRAMPEWTALSYSNFKTDPDIVTMSKPRMMKASPRKVERVGSGVVYSPFTNEMVVATPD